MTCLLSFISLPCVTTYFIFPSVVLEFRYIQCAALYCAYFNAQSSLIHMKYTYAELLITVIVVFEIHVLEIKIVIKLCLK